MKATLFTAIIVLLGACAQQNDQESMSEVTTASISIPTAQCSMCEDAITEALMASEGVQQVTVDMETKSVEVTFVSASVTIDDLETVITQTGYDANDQRADPEAYENLAACCKLPDDDTEESMDSM